METYKIANKYTRLLRIYVKSLVLTLSLILYSCGKGLLEEVPLDFYSPENSYVTIKDFEAANLDLYSSFRQAFWANHSSLCPQTMFVGTDLTYYSQVFSSQWPLYLTPTNNEMISGIWSPCYKIIYDANVIIGRADAKVSKLSDIQKVKIKAEASFFRGYAYKLLANLYGGVPITIKETTEPKRDYVRASREEVYLQSASDLKFAAENLDDIDKVDDSRISNLTAYHVLSEVYISLNQWQNAIDAATIVINHPSVALMTQRFGTRMHDPNYGGDVYWDLFRKGNQNRSSGDKESLWVLQFEYNMEFSGGGKGGTNVERMLIPPLWRCNIYNKNGKLQLLIPYPNTFYYGRGLGAWQPTKYFFKELWEKSGYNQDMRNSQYNIVRDFKVDNPASDWNGKWLFADKLPVKMVVASDTQSCYPVIAKASDPGLHPLALYLPDQTVPGSLQSTARYTFRDWCVIRLAETYLLRAEAFLGIGNKTKAAEDINVVRRRANAPDVSSAVVDIDYILDERLRELHFEELRTATLTRLGKLVERTRKYNSCVPYTERNNLWPIPFSEIEKNTGAVLEQNPGY